MNGDTSNATLDNMAALVASAADLRSEIKLLNAEIAALKKQNAKLVKLLRKQLGSHEDIAP